MNELDPKKLKILLVHGTFARGGVWHRPGSALHGALATLLGADNIDSCEWSGWNTHHARVSGAPGLRDKIRNLSEGPQDVLIIAHSHGANVVAQALEDPDIRDMTRGVCTLAAPFVTLRYRDVLSADWMFYVLYLFSGFAMMAIPFTILIFASVDTPFVVPAVATYYLMTAASVYQLREWVRRRRLVMHLLPVTKVAIFLRAKWRKQLRKWQTFEFARAGENLWKIPFLKIITIRKDEAYLLLSSQCRIASVLSFVLDRKFTMGFFGAVMAAGFCVIFEILAWLDTLRTVVIVVAGLYSILLGPIIFAAIAVILVLKLSISIALSRMMHFVFGGSPIGLGSFRLWDGLTAVYSVSQTPCGQPVAGSDCVEEFEIRKPSITTLRHCKVYEDPAVIASVVEWVAKCTATVPTKSSAVGATSSAT